MDLVLLVSSWIKTIFAQCMYFINLLRKTLGDMSPDIYSVIFRVADSLDIGWYTWNGQYREKNNTIASVLLYLQWNV